MFGSFSGWWDDVRKENCSELEIHRDHTALFFSSCNDSGHSWRCCLVSTNETPGSKCKREDYVQYAQTGGVKERFIIYRYVLRNAMLPQIAVGLSFGTGIQRCFDC